MLISMYLTLNDPVKGEIFKSIFRHLYDPFRDAEAGVKRDQRWESTEIELYIKGFDYRYGNVLHECIPSSKKNPFDHIAIRAWIPTR